MVESDGIRKAAEDELQKLMGRVNKHQEYYLSNSMISSTFNFLKIHGKSLTFAERHCGYDVCSAFLFRKCVLR